MKPNLAVAPIGGLTLPRQALAAAITALADEEKRAAALNNALAAARRGIDAAYTRQSDAQAEVAAAIEAQTNAMIMAADTDVDFKDDGRLSAARMAEVQATDEITTAKAALTALEARKPHLNYLGEGPVEAARKNLDASAVAVIRDEVDLEPMLKAVEATMQKLAAQRAEIVHFVTNELVSSPQILRRMQDAVAGGQMSDVLPCLSFAGSVMAGQPWPTSTEQSWPNRAMSPPRLLWKATMAALKADPNAPLPRGSS